MRRYYINLPRSAKRYIVFAACPEVLVINLAAPRRGKIIQLHYDRSPLPADFITDLRGGK